MAGKTGSPFPGSKVVFDLWRDNPTHQGELAATVRIFVRLWRKRVIGGGRCTQYAVKFKHRKDQKRRLPLNLLVG